MTDISLDPIDWTELTAELTYDNAEALGWDGTGRFEAGPFLVAHALARIDAVRRLVVAEALYDGGYPNDLPAHVLLDDDTYQKVGEEVRSVLGPEISEAISCWWTGNHAASDDCLNVATWSNDAVVKWLSTILAEAREGDAFRRQFSPYKEQA